MARAAKIVITSVNNAGAGIQAAAKDLVSLESNAVRVAKGIQQAFSAVAIAAAAKQVVQFGIESVKAFGEVERKMTQLKVALGGNESSFDRLNEHIEDLSKVTLASKGDVQSLVSQLAALGKSDADIERISEAAVNLSNVTGQGLNEAMKQVNATFSGSTDELGKLVPELRGLTKEQLAAGDGVDLLNAKFKDISDSMAGGVSQGIKNLSDNFGDLKENIGESLLKAFTPMLNGINSTIEGWNQAYDAFSRYKKAMVDDPELAAHIKKERDTLRAMQAFKPETMAGQARLAGDPQYQAKLKQAYDDAVAARKLYEESTLPSTPRVSGVAAPSLGMGGSSAPVATGSGSGAAPTDPFNFYGMPWDTGMEFGPYPAPAGQGTSLLGMLADASSIGSYRDARGEYGPAADVDYTPAFADIMNKFADITSGVTSASFSAAGDSSVAGSGPLGALGDALGPITDAFGSLLGSLGPVMEIIDPIGTILASMMEVLGPLIEEALAPLTGLLVIFGKILAMTLIPLINIITPIIKGIASVFIWLANKVLIPVGNLFIDIMRGIIHALNKIPGVNIKKPSRLENISLADATAAGTSSSSSGGTTAGASYTGSQPITFNFYNQGNVVGSGGLEELALLIESILQRNARYA
ncbi:MAG: phage tail tape measure protein [Clostridia bacterium]